LPFLQNRLNFGEIGIMATEKMSKFIKKRQFLDLTSYLSDIFAENQGAIMAKKTGGSSTISLLR
jgi:hypothetical protein